MRGGKRVVCVCVLCRVLFCCAIVCVRPDLFSPDVLYANQPTNQPSAAAAKEKRATRLGQLAYCKIEVKPRPWAVKVYPPKHKFFYFFLVWSYVLAHRAPVATLSLFSLFTNMFSFSSRTFACTHTHTRAQVTSCKLTRIKKKKKKKRKKIRGLLTDDGLTPL